MMDITSSNGAKNIHSSSLSCDGSVGEKRKRNEYGQSCGTGNRVVHNSRRGVNGNGDAEMGQESVQPKNGKRASLTFNDFGKLREEVSFVVGQTWALYDTMDGMPRLYAQIRKVSAPCFGLRITYLEPDPVNEKELQWFEEDLPVAVGKFRLGRNLNTKDRLMFSHVIQCNEGSDTDHFSIIPRKGETWALFKNWDIKWSSEPDSHRKYEYEFVEVVSDYDDEAGVFVAYLHKAKGFASVFFRMGTGSAEVFRILRHSLYRFSHRVPSFKLTGTEGEGVPKDAYELDQAALPETIEEKIAPSHPLGDPAASNSTSNIKSKPQIIFASNGKVFQTGQIWSYSGPYLLFPLYYGKIQKITFTQVHGQEAVYKLHVSRLIPTRFPDDVIQYDDKKMPVSCGTYYARKVVEIITLDDVSQQIVPETSLDGNEYTILPKIGEVWVIYRFWTPYREFKKVGVCSYDIVEILDDSVDYEVLLLEKSYVPKKRSDYNDIGEVKHMFYQACTEYKDNEIDGSEPIFTIPKSERLRFSHKVPASHVTKEVSGELKDLIQVDYSNTWAVLRLLSK